jgi:flagellar biosynthesis GTPase FlhF
VKVQDNVELPNKTGAGEQEEPILLPTKFQDHGDPVRFRNVWLVDRGLATGNFPIHSTKEEVEAAAKKEAEKKAAEKKAAEKKAAEKKAAEKKAAEKKAAEKKAAAKKAAEKAATEKAATEKAATEKAATEKAATEKAATENKPEPAAVKK